MPRIVASFDVVSQRPVPWSAPTLRMDKNQRTGRMEVRADYDRALCAWKDAVRERARKAMAGRPVETGRVGLRLAFYRATPAGEELGGPWTQRVEWNGSRRQYRGVGASVGDVTNFQKGLEDALQGIVIGDDVQVEEVSSKRCNGPWDGARVEVYAIGPA